MNTLSRTKGSISKKNGNYLARLFIGNNEKGKRIYWSKSLSTLKEAQAALSKRTQQLNDYGKIIEPSKEPLGQFLDSWLENNARPRVSKKTFVGYSGCIERYIKPFIGMYPLKKLSAEIIQELYASMLKKDLSSRTVRFTHSVLRNALNQAVRLEKIHSNPTLIVDLPRYEKREMRAMTVEECKLFLDEIEGTIWQQLFKILLITGMRPSEALGLKWSDIDLNRKVLTINRSLSRPKCGGEWLFAPTKTKKSRRTIPLNAMAVESLYRQKRAQNKEKKQFDEHEFIKKDKNPSYSLREYASHNLVFAALNGEPAHNTNILNRHFKPIVSSLSMEDLRIYDLRHTCATLLLQAGENPKVVSDLLGHASVTLTLDTYSHVQPGMKEAACAKLQDILTK